MSFVDDSTSTASAPRATRPVLDRAPLEHLTMDLKSENNRCMASQLCRYVTCERHVTVSAIYVRDVSAT